MTINGDGYLYAEAFTIPSVDISQRTLGTMCHQKLTQLNVYQLNDGWDPNEHGNYLTKRPSIRYDPVVEEGTKKIELTCKTQRPWYNGKKKPGAMGSAFMSNQPSPGEIVCDGSDSRAKHVKTLRVVTFLTQAEKHPDYAIRPFATQRNDNVTQVVAGKVARSPCVIFVVVAEQGKEVIVVPIGIFRSHMGPIVG
ncbi:hypothetical protein ACLMJK_004540 [Lecanora helva]